MRHFAFLGLVLCGVAGAASADEIVLPAQVVERGRPLDILYRLPSPGPARGTLRIEWTDAVGRVVERRMVPFELKGAAEVRFRLDTSRALTTWNRLEVHRAGAAAAASFIVSPPPADWRDFPVIMWQAQTPQAYATLRRNGIAAGALGANRTPPFTPPQEALDNLLRSGMRYYVENIATDFYSAYHRWFPDRAVNWRFLELQQRYRQDRDEAAAFRRDPSLSDPQWLATIDDRLAATVALHRADRPLFYNLADEAGIADLAAYWDFDVSEPSLAGFREWLRTDYPDLAALNAEWGTEFARWDDVTPATTPAAMRRSDGNFAAWADFKAWMDVAFARALAAGRDRIHAADPSALAGLEGVQVPGWGGYDYALLADAVDVMELDDRNFGLVLALNPRLRLLSVSSGGGRAEARHVWRAWLRGARGLILWDDKQEFVRADGTLGPSGRDAMPYLRALSDGLGALVSHSERQTDPVAILYSPASLRTQWMLDWKDKGDAWIERGSEAEGGDDNTVRAAMSGYRDAIERLGLQPSFVTPDAVEAGALDGARVRVLVLPHAVALSDAAIGMIRRFVAAGGTIVADVEPSLFDQHSRRRDAPPLQDLVPPDTLMSAPSTPAALEPFRAVLAAHGVTPAVALADASGAPTTDVEMHRFRDGGVTILALQRVAGGAAAPQPISLTLPSASVVYDLRARRSLGRQRELRLALDPFEPTLLALADRELPRPSLQVEASVARGETAMLRIGVPRPSGAAFQPLHVEIEDPFGKRVAWYSGNVAASTGTVSRPLPLALNDPIGVWRIGVTDVLSGQTTVMPLTVRPR
jgi:hypothetical protein